ncbi:c-type cytochrome [Sulfuriferula nivalis]|uniref:Cytochrome c n=1 Tax=Sulfuriferula nivalis TaxID=2675298 RepID=A0A809SF23_9PROT|nr:c-type cytochrome [Sulfuriferula nivalis]BBP01907.1 cytochrome c [Sulfuriferula nivalis]
MKNTMAFAAFAALTAFSTAHAEDTAVKGDPAKAQQLVTTVCAACHGADGNSTSPTYPKLAGQHAEYITKQLMNFKSGDRKNPIMFGIVTSNNLTPENMKDLGAYFASQTEKPGMAKDKELVEAGEKIYKGGNAASGVPACAACHGPTGAGIPVQFPRLASQHKEYIYTQLNNFRLGDRANDGGKMMRTIAAKLTDQEMKAVAEYISGLH